MDENESNQPQTTSAAQEVKPEDEEEEEMDSLFSEHEERKCNAPLGSQNFIISLQKE